MWPRFGLKIGNSTLCISHVSADSKIDVIANIQGERITHACVWWDGTKELECGLTAKQKMASRPNQAIANSFQVLMPDNLSIKTVIEAGRKSIPCEYDTETKMFRLTCQQEDGKKESVKTFSAYQVHLELCRAQLQLAKQHFVEDKGKKPIVVLSVPNYYKHDAWKCLADVVEAAGFHVAQTMSDSTAATLAYDLTANLPPDTPRYVLTIKSGGIFSHFALYVVVNGYYMLLESFGPYAIGGRDYTEMLVQYISDEFYRKYKMDPSKSRRCVERINAAAENCKHVLSNLPATQLYIDSLMDGCDICMQISRARFDGLIQPLVTRFMQSLNECMVLSRQNKNYKIWEIDAIILLGGTTKIPKLQAAISAMFPKSRLHHSLPTDEVVAIGCARQATFLPDPEAKVINRTVEHIYVDDDVYIWHGNDEKNSQLLVAKGTKLPTNVKLHLKRDPQASNAELFSIRSSHEIITMVMYGSAEKVKDDVFHVEAEVVLKPGNSQNLPLIKLQCL